MVVLCIVLIHQNLPPGPSSMFCDYQCFYNKPSLHTGAGMSARSLAARHFDTWKFSWVITTLTRKDGVLFPFHRWRKWRLKRNERLAWECPQLDDGRHRSHDMMFWVLVQSSFCHIAINPEPGGNIHNQSTAALGRQWHSFPQTQNMLFGRNALVVNRGPG